MSIVDYGQCAEDHQRMLVLVQQVGCHMASKTFSRLFDRIAKVQEVDIPNNNRTVHLRYKKTYAKKNSEWGDFQAHRKIIGLICLGAYEDEDEVTQLSKLYSDITQLYSSTLFDSRLFIFGPEVIDRSANNQRNGAVKSGAKSKRLRSDSRGPFDDPLSASLLQRTACSQEQTQEQVLSECKKSPAKLVSGSTHIIHYPTTEDCGTLEERLKEFVASLFWVLEGKRLDRSFERQERIPMLTAPFEKKDMVGLDIDSRTYRKRYQGRLRKQTGDLCLLAGLPGEAVLQYQAALDILKVAADWLWVAACYEGMCSASVSKVEPQVEKTSFQRNMSFSMKRGASALNEAGLLIGSLTRAYSNGLDLTDDRLRNCLLPRDVVDKYREAMMHYSKFKNAGIIELEACLKACRVLIKHKAKL
ncbi:hypothetical protein NP493_259g02024 [Ridgeia piscesae]|uniref:Trs120/TRAPPC9 N-terminal domain-containing protein n=1 Tax=Ridgeia piscesae TaxID=27915 RepID=A0AAD9NY89_RIDPI|nr:hypothetical protein NP493_259g02024 [Ridgeia piscesae]